jgi:two-component system, NtrC family, response regulator
MRERVPRSTQQREEWMAKIILVDCDDERRRCLASILNRPHKVLARNAADGSPIPSHASEFDLLIVALELIVQSNTDVLAALRRTNRDIPAIIVASGKEAMDHDAALRKAIDIPHTTALIGSVNVHEVLEKVNFALAFSAPKKPLSFRFEALLGSSPEMRTVHRRMLAVADTDGPVLLVGETGTGKETVARELHRLRQHKKNSGATYETVQCRYLSNQQDDLARLLFGFEQPGQALAVSIQRGLLERGSDFAVYLDGVTALQPLLQIKLLRALESRELQRIGATLLRPFQTHVLAGCTEHELDHLMPDLLEVFGANRIELPPLRFRSGDIQELVDFFIANGPGHRRAECDPDSMDLLVNYTWPGNVSELKRIVEHATVHCENGCIQVWDLPPEIQNVRTRGIVFRSRLGH